MPLTPHARGLLLTALGVLILSPDSLLIRLVDTDIWTLSWWRGILGFVLMFAAVLVFNRRSLFEIVRDIPFAGFLVASLYALSNLGFVAALSSTTAANALLIIATTPLWAALLSWFWLGEKLARPTQLALAICAVGLVIIFGDELRRHSGLGELFALVASWSLAINLVLIRRLRRYNMIPMSALGAGLVALVALPFAEPMSLNAVQIGWMAVLCAFVLPVSFALITLGPRHLFAAEVAMLFLIETVLGPIWVWLVIGEKPTAMALAGGAMIVLTLMGHSVWRLGWLPARTGSKSRGPL